MPNEVSKLQKRRAENIIWNAAENHGFTPDFRAFDGEGNAELYWNCIIGAARRHYDYNKFIEVFKTLDRYEDAALYNGLFWLGLENAVYPKELGYRPALESLRKEYAEKLVSELAGTDDTQIYEYLECAHFRRVLGQNDRLDSYNKRLLDALEFSPDMTDDEIVERVKDIFSRWFQVTDKHREKKRLSFGIKRPKKRSKQQSKFGRGFALHTKSAYGGTDATDISASDEIKTRLTANQLREFMEFKFGEQMFTENKIAEIERKLCIDNHDGCKLLFTKGVPAAGNINNAFESLQKQKEARQAALNRQRFYDNYAENMTVISKLTGKIRNSVLLYMNPTDVSANYGRLIPKLCWRAEKLDDNRIFVKQENADMGNLSVDILLDASTSQRSRQEIVSNQGYIIAESLKRCGIANRVMSFCSMTGYTIIRIYKDYNETANNDRIFEYVSNGCNRDGLAIRAAHYLMQDTPYEHKLLIVLSDVKPNDVKKIRSEHTGELIPYDCSAGLTDTAHEVRRARMDGISTVCVFTGADEDLPSAKMVYGHDFARVQSLDKFADTVASLIQNQIKVL